MSRGVPLLRSMVVAAAALALGAGALVLEQWQRNRSGGVDVFAQLFAKEHGLMQPTQQQAGTTPPAPPPQPGWRTPLRRTCTAAADRALLERLQQRIGELRASKATVAIDPSNYGERFARDAFGNRIDPTPSLVVLHETVYGIGSAINTFVTPHPNEADQVSYHTLIGLDGAVVQVLDPQRRAFGSGNSAFNGDWVITNPAFRGSVNNFALHVSLETPLDGEDADASHSGYTAAQYDALAALLDIWMDRFRIPFQRITTHAYVDLGGERSDPRSFDWSALQQRLDALGVLCP